MKFSKKNKIAILLLLGIGISGFVLGFITPRITLFSSEAAGWGKPQANIENKEIKIDVYDVFFVAWDEGEPSEDLNRFTLKILLNVSNPFEETGLIIPRLDVSIGHLGLPVARIWSLDRFSLDPFNVNENALDTIEEQQESRFDTKAADLWPIYLSLYTGEGSGINEFINDLFVGELGRISFNAKIDLGNYPINLEGVIGDVLEVIGLGFGGTETGSITDENIVELLVDALGADLGSIEIAARSDSIFLYNTTDTKTGENDVRALFDGDNVRVLNNELDEVYFGCKDPFDAIYLANASGMVLNKSSDAADNEYYLDSEVANYANGSGKYHWEYYNGTTWEDLTLDLDSVANFSFNDTGYESWQTGYINFTIPTDWDRAQLVSFFPQNYYYVRVGILDDNAANLDQNTSVDDSEYLRINVKYSRIKTSVPNEAPDSEDSTVFGTGGIAIDEQTILADDDETIIYPGINPDYLPTTEGLIQYGDFDEYLNETCGLNIFGLIEPLVNDTYSGDGLFLGLTKLAKKDDINYDIDEDFPILNEDEAFAFYKLFIFLYSHNLSAAELLTYSQLNIAAVVEGLCNAIPDAYFTSSENWVGLAAGDTDFADSESIYDWSEQAGFKSAMKTSWLLFGIMGAIALMSVTYAIVRKQDQSKYLSDGDISNVDDLKEDDSGKTVLVGTVNSMDSEKANWELLGGMAAVGIGMLLYALKYYAFPDFNDGAIFQFLPSVFSSIFENSRNITDNAYSPLVILMTAFVDFPGCLAWLLPSIYVSYKRNKQFTNIKKRRVGWDIFWKGAYIIEILLAIMCLGLGLSTMVGNQDLISYFGGGMIFIIFLFITPYFYFSIGIAGLGGFIGTRLGLKSPGESEVTFTEEYLAKGDDYVGTSDYDEYAEYDEEEYEEYEDTDRTEIVDFDSKSEVVGMVCKYCWETYPVGTDSCGKCGNTDVSQAIECPNCGNMIPIDAKFCNECGSQR